MAIINIVLLASAVLPAVIAVPQHGHLAHGHYKRSHLPSGLSTGFPHPSGVPGAAPYSAQNATASGATGTGRGPVTIQSTVNVVPLPITHTKYAASSTGGIDQAGASGSPGDSSSGGSGSGNGESGAECGPATVTVTHANTVTVTVGGSNGGAPSNAPAQSSPAVPSIPAVPSSAPYPVDNSSIPTGSTGTIGAVLPSIPTQAPVPTSAEVSSSAAPVEVASSAASSPAPVISSSAPVEAASSAATTSVAVVPTSSVEAHAYYDVPGAGGEHHSPKVPASIPVSFPAPVASSSVSSAPVELPTTSAPAPVVSSPASQVASSAPASSSSSAPVKSNTGLKARGLLYGGPEANSALSNANTYLSAGNGAMGWGWNWDSSPAPAAGHKKGTLDVQFVPMLLSAIDVHTSLWDENSAGYPYLMGFNEPDMTTDKGGSQMDVDTCVQNWNTYLQPKASGSVKLISPATTNDLESTSVGLHYMTSFLEKCSSCTIDVLAFHYYGKADDLEYFKKTVSMYKDLQTKHGIPELWITEMAPNDLPTKEQMDAFLKYLDGESGVTRYAFNGLNTGTGQSLDNVVIKESYCS